MQEDFEFGNCKSSYLGKKEENNKYDYVYDYKNFDLEKKNDSHAAIVRQVKEKSTVLDIGCSSGIIGQILYYKKNCEIDGIEYDKETAELARKTKAYKNVYNFSITDPASKDFQEYLKLNKKYDYIIFGDVLEHLYNPWEILGLMPKFMKKNAKIVISLPNVAHLDIIKGLINGKFNYSKVGLLDDTHIRFFTASSFCDMLKNLAEEQGIYYSCSLKEKIIAVPKYVNDSKIFELFNVDDYLENLLVLQNIFVLKLENKKEHMQFENTKEFKEYFNRMNEYYTAILNDRIRLEQEISNTTQNLTNLKEEYQKLEDRNKEIDNQYRELINSKRWKLVNKIFRIFGR